MSYADRIAIPSAEGFRGVALAGAAAGACVATGFMLAHSPWLAAGVVLGTALFLLTLVRPLVVIGGMLAIGPIDLSFMTGGFKGLLEEQGGLDMNGIRLIGMVVALSAILVADPASFREAVGRHGRFYLLFLVFAAGTLLFSDANIDGLRLLLKLAYPFLIFVALLGTVRSRADLERLGDVVLVSAAAIGLVLMPLLIAAGAYEMTAEGRLRIPTVGVHQNPMSFYLLAVILLSFARFSVRGQVRYLVLCAVMAAWMMAALTRIAVLGTLAGLIGIALFSALVVRNYRAVFGAMIVAALIAVPLLPLVLKRTFGYVPTPGELLSLARSPVDLFNLMNWQGREILWPVVLKAFASSPVVGLGIGSSTAVLLANFPQEWGTVVHNEYLRLAADTGSIGVALFAIAIIAWWIGVLRAGRTPDPLAREYALPAFAGLVAWAVIAFTDNAFDYYAQFTQYIAFLCAGALVAARLSYPPVVEMVKPSAEVRPAGAAAS